MRPEGWGTVARLRDAARRRGDTLRFVWCGPVPPPGEMHLPGTGREVEAALAERLLAPGGPTSPQDAYVRS